MLRNRYDSGMTVKITVSLPDELVADARAAVEARQAASVSGYVATAMRSFAEQQSTSTADLDGWEAFLAEAYAANGEPTAEDRAWARAALGLDLESDRE